MSLSRNQEKTADLIRGYIDIVVECAENPGMRERFVNHPENHQTEIHEKLKQKGFIIPDNAFVAFDGHSMTSKIIMFQKDSEDKIVTVEQNLLVQSIINFDAPDFEKIQHKQELEIITVNVKEVLEKYKVFIILPFLVISAARVNFSGKEEILLSTC